MKYKTYHVSGTWITIVSVLMPSTNELNFTLPGAGKPTKPVSKVQPMQPSGKPSGNDDRQDPASLPGPNLGAGTLCIGNFHKQIRLYYMLLTE